MFRRNISLVESQNQYKIRSVGTFGGEGNKHI